MLNGCHLLPRDVMQTATYYSRFTSPIGELLLVSDGEAITGLTMHQNWDDVTIPSDWIAAEEPFADVKTELAEYFAGELHEFTVPVKLIGTEFQLQAWEQLKSIPYGETITYGEQARRLGNPSASRAVGAANGRNPISIIIPCHRVIGSTGHLIGYGGGVNQKEYLLKLETHSMATTR